MTWRELLQAYADAMGVPRASAQGDPWKAAQAAFSRGETAYLSGKYDDATEAFKQAYASRPMPQFLYNIAAANKGTKTGAPMSMGSDLARAIEV